MVVFRWWRGSDSGWWLLYLSFHKWSLLFILFVCLFVDFRWWWRRRNIFAGCWWFDFCRISGTLFFLGMMECRGRWWWGISRISMRRLNNFSLINLFSLSLRWWRGWWNFGLMMIFFRGAKIFDICFWWWWGWRSCTFFRNWEIRRLTFANFLWWLLLLLLFLKWLILFCMRRWWGWHILSRLCRLNRDNIWPYGWRW